MIRKIRWSENIGGSSRLVGDNPAFQEAGDNRRLYREVHVLRHVTGRLNHLHGVELRDHGLDQIPVCIEKWATAVSCLDRGSYLEMTDVVP
ncbi:hypothetical protein [Microvirga pakistanensis]|uniref:hypothetical protein n=1 Tax=Microvirga pakistanensis TaxID=1682650 RepID=UPI001069F740|nr:hypothetical protein [Microvirga pakistanensis]